MVSEESKRWRRLEDLEDNKVLEFRQTVIAFEKTLDEAKSAYADLQQYFNETDQEIQKTNAIHELQSIQRSRDFLESLRTALKQQQSSILQKEQHLESLKEQLLLLYQKKESYGVLAETAETNAQKAQNRLEQKNLDELAQNSYLRSQSQSSNPSKKDI